MSVSPQRYLWRIAIALHCLPRFAVPFMYYNYYHSLLHNVHTYHRLYKILTSVNFWCNTIESAALVAVSYISNKDNYRKYNMVQLFLISACMYSLQVMCIEGIYVFNQIWVLFYNNVTFKRNSTFDVYQFDPCLSIICMPFFTWYVKSEYLLDIRPDCLLKVSSPIAVEL